MSSCSGNCASCGSDCADRKAESLLANLNPNSTVKKVIAVVSGIEILGFLNLVELIEQILHHFSDPSFSFLGLYAVNI